MRHILPYILILLSFAGFSQKTISVQGYVTNAQTNERLIGAQIYFYNSKTSIITNEKGYYNCTILKQDSVIVAYVGYSDFKTQIICTHDTTINFILQPNSTEISKVIITENKINENITHENIGQINITNSGLRDLPTLMGESDVIRTLASTGGVTQIEGMQGMFVRGGGQEQNLMLYDGATIYNASHVLGFFSVFNSDIISNAVLYKSYIPGKYGGRLSSILSIKTSTDNSNFYVKSSFGILSSRLTCNIPINPKSTIMVSVRKTYLNYIVMPLVEKTIKKNDDLQTEFGFYDASCRYDFRPNTSNRFSLSVYSGKDNFDMQNSFTRLQNNVNWGNFAISSNWTKVGIWNQSATASYSNYTFNFSAKQNYYNLTIGTGISNGTIRYSTSKRISTSHVFETGGQIQLQDFNTGTIDAIINNESFQSTPPLLSRSIEGSMFAEDTWEATKRITITGCLRAIPYAQIGPASEYIYNASEIIIDTIQYSSTDILYKNVGIEPRFVITYLFDSASIHGTITRNIQNIHMGSMLSAALPADIWMPASSKLPRETGLQYTVSFNKDFKNHMYQTSANVYYKTMKNVVEFKDGFITMYSTSFNQKVTQGKGFACGTEISIDKKIGTITGGVTYNFSRTLRKFTEINNSILYPASYDKPNDFTIQAQYSCTKKIKLSALWVYSSGKVYSEPVSKYFINKNLLSEYGAVNNKRMPDYHRLDIGAEYQIVSKPNYEMIVQASIYNAYNRNNIYYIYYETLGDIENFSIDLVKNNVGLFPMLPSVSLQIQIK